MRITAVAMLLGVFAPSNLAKTLIVGKPETPCPSPAYNTVTAAITAAQPGDTVQVCPGLYAEQLVISKPLTLEGLSQQNVNRVVIQPAQVGTTPGFSFAAVISVVNTSNVTLTNLAIDAGNNTISGCSPVFSGIRFYNASGVVDGVAISGARLRNPASCAEFFPGNGFGILADTAAGATGTYHVGVLNSSIHEFSRDAVLVIGAGMVAQIDGNSIAGIGPSSGVNQFGIFLANGVTGQVVGNNITQGTCASLALTDCIDLRSEGIVLRSTGANLLVSGNVINNVQAGIFVNGASDTAPVRNVRIIGNLISNVEGLSAVHLQGSAGGLVSANRIFHVGPFVPNINVVGEGCGVLDVPGTGSSGNTIVANWTNDAYCGVAYTGSDRVQGNTYLNVLYPVLNADTFTTSFPPPVEPGQPPTAAPSPAVKPRQANVR